MRRGTTPTVTFSLPFDSAQIDVLSIAFSQDGKVIIEKNKDDCILTGNIIDVKLEEIETLTLKEGIVEMQIRASLTNGSKIASNIMRMPTRRILKEGGLQNV